MGCVEAASPISETSAGSWEVETIRMMMKDGANEYFLVKWKDWPYSSMTWEPESNLTMVNGHFMQLEVAFQRELYQKKLKVSKLVDKKLDHEKIWATVTDQSGPSRKRLLRHLQDFYVAEVHRKKTGMQRLFCELAEQWTHPNHHND